MLKKNLLLLRLLLLCLALYTDGAEQAYAARLQSDVGTSASSNTQASLIPYPSYTFLKTEDKSADLHSTPVQGQGRCLSNDDVKRMLAQVNSSQSATLNQKLSDELLKLRVQNQQRLDDDIRDNRKPDELRKRISAMREKNSVRLCSILRQYGWATKSLVGKEGVEAAIFMLNDSSSQLRVDMLPVVIAATKQGEISRSDFAGYVDRLRIDSGLKQVFGTQATIIDGFLVLFPIEAEEHVDSRRKQYDLLPLALYVRFLESKYRLPLIKSTGTLTNKFSDSARSSVARATSVDLMEGQTLEQDEVVRIETNLVSFNVSVFSKQLRTQVTTLTQNDFTISEDGQPQAITYFAATDAPFDLVLLIDLSGSTTNKRKLIRKSTQRFIEAARPSDRLAIVTFSDNPYVASPLTSDRAKLLESLNRMEEGNGSSHVWDALKYTLDHVIGEKSLERRRAVVFMTDGADNALDHFEGGSETNFADLLEAVRSDAVLIIPIYLDTEGDDHSAGGKRLYENARKTLTRMADESGGLYYKAKKIEDLEGVYSQVIADLGKVYSLGYKPTNEKRDHTWRTVIIQLPNLPDLITRARPGYYAN